MMIFGMKCTWASVFFGCGPSHAKEIWWLQAIAVQQSMTLQASQTLGTSNVLTDEGHVCCLHSWFGYVWMLWPFIPFGPPLAEQLNTKDPFLQAKILRLLRIFGERNATWTLTLVTGVCRIWFFTVSVRAMYELDESLDLFAHVIIMF